MGAPYLLADGSLSVYGNLLGRWVAKEWPTYSSPPNIQKKNLCINRILLDREDIGKNVPDLGYLVQHEEFSLAQ
jgi:hypothetical protein